MNRIYASLTLFVFVAFCLASYAGDTTPGKRALIIAIGNYPKPDQNGWGPIASVNDTAFVRKGLEAQGFNAEAIRVITDSKATKEGIVEAMNRLITEAQVGEVCVIHISSHGVQLEDDDTDEEIDGKDECIVPFGAVYRDDPEQYDRISPGYLRDDEFGALVTALRRKLGPAGDLLVTVDACHSGSATRGSGACRGNKPALVSGRKNPAATRGNIRESNTAFEEQSRDAAASGLSGYTVISAARAEEPNWEIRDTKGKPVGPLSFALAEVLTTNTENLTYRGLFAGIQAIMNEKANRQQPVLEGDEKDRLIFGGKITKQLPYFEISKSRSAGEAIIKAGAVQGLRTGSKVSFYELGKMPGKGQPVDSGSVTEAGNFESRVLLSNDKAFFTERQYQAYVTEQNYGDGVVKVFIYDRDGKAKVIKSALADGRIDLVADSTVADLVFDKWNNRGSWALFVGNTDLPYDTGFTGTASDTGRLRERIREFGQYRFLLQLKNDAPNLGVRLDIVPLVNGVPDEKALSGRLDSTGIVEITEGEQVVFKLTNTGSAQVYVNILDLQPDGVINALLPNAAKNITADELRLEPYQSLLLTKMKIAIGPPYGTEILKVFVTREQLNLESLATTRGVGTKGNMRSALDTYFKKSYTLTRGTSVYVDPDGTVTSVPFRIVPRKTP